MPERHYFVICEDNCKFEGMTKEQIYDAIAEATGHTPTPVDEAFITMIKEQNASHNLKMWKGTEAQYNALSVKDPDTLYIINTNEVRAGGGEITYPIGIDKGGTGATTEEAARTNLGLKGAETKTLLWTNASPTSAFGAQTLSLNITNYNAIEIVFKNYSTYTSGWQNAYRTIKVNKINTWSATNGIIETTFDTYLDSYFISVVRGFSFTNSGITFMEAQYKQSNSTIRTADDTKLIPVKIYGIKEV